MLKIFIVAVLCLILYQFMYTVIEGLEGDGSGDEKKEEVSSSSSSSISTNNNNCGMTIAERNVFLLNDRVNQLQSQYTDLSGNIATLNKQMEELMKQNENAAKDMVGNQPLDISVGGTSENSGPSSEEAV
jgi:TolA-binding protein